MAGSTRRLSSAHVVSPCVSICVLDGETGFCLGCQRSRDEIQSWPRLSADEKQRLLDELEQRRAVQTPPLQQAGG